MMQFLQPSLLWGMLAVAIPIAIHLWHQKKGKVIAWAATQWLMEKSQQSQRGLRLDNLLLLVLRCLILIVLAMMLAEPFFRKSDFSSTQKKIHLVQPEALVVDNYRFELEEAQQKGEPIYWVALNPRPVEELLPPESTVEAGSPVTLQTAINQLSDEEAELHLYIQNKRTLAQLPQIQTSIDFQLHTVPDTLRRKARPYRLAANNQKLYINADNRLRVGQADPDITFASEPAGDGVLRAMIDLQNPGERKTVEAALRAFAEVYGLDLTMEEEKAADGTYTVVVTHRVPSSVDPATLYVVAGQAGRSAYPNVVFTPDTLTPQTSPLVANGRLPEWLGQLVLDHIGLSGDAALLTSAELKTLFKPMKPTSGIASASVQRVFFIVLLVLILLERSNSLTKNA